MTKQEYKQVVKQGGGTFINGLLTEIKTGYSVGIKNINIIDRRVLKGEENIITMINSLTEDQNVFGLWIDRGLIYIDWITIVDDLDSALTIARANNEKAIYDNLLDKEIKVIYKGDE